VELLLNLVWLLLAAGILCTWRTRWVHQRPGTIGASLREWTAVTVALVLLFFAVSMSDDLHLEMALFEEVSTSRRSAPHSVEAQNPTAHPGATLHSAGAAVAPSVIGIETDLYAFRCLAVAVSPHFEALAGAPTLGRAPPTSVSRS